MLLLLFFSLKVEWLSVLNAMQLLPLPASYPVSPDDGENSDVLVRCYSLLLSGNIVKGKERKRTCIAPIVSISTTKRSDVDHTELPATHHICLSFV